MTTGLKFGTAGAARNPQWQTEKRENWFLHVLNAIGTRPTIAPIWRANMQIYLSRVTSSSKMRTVSVEEQIMSNDEYTSIFSRKLEAIVFTVLHAREKVFRNSLLHAGVGCFLMGVLWYNLINQKIFPFSCNNRKIFSLKWTRKLYPNQDVHNLYSRGRGCMISGSQEKLPLQIYLQASNGAQLILPKDK